MALENLMMAASSDPWDPTSDRSMATTVRGVGVTVAEGVVVGDGV
jgi:hypothetical protein